MISRSTSESKRVASLTEEKHTDINQAQLNSALLLFLVLQIKLTNRRLAHYCSNSVFIIPSSHQFHFSTILSDITSSLFVYNNRILNAKYKIKQLLFLTNKPRNETYIQMRCCAYVPKSAILL